MASSNFAQAVLIRFRTYLLYIVALWWLFGELLEHVTASGNDLSSSAGCCNLCYVKGICIVRIVFVGWQNSCTGSVNDPWVCALDGGRVYVPVKSWHFLRTAVRVRHVS